MKNDPKPNSFVITNHHELRRRVTVDCSSPILTDQSYKNACDINVIMEQYAKTGLLAHQTSKEPQYLDNTLVPSLEVAFDIVSAASEAFFSLPPDVRKLMDNDPSQMENFVSNDENAEILKKHGLIISKAEPPESTLSKVAALPPQDPPPA
nr:MAG: internal scaffolding protein [Microvirus sp.]